MILKYILKAIPKLFALITFFIAISACDRVSEYLFLVENKSSYIIQVKGEAKVGGTNHSIIDILIAPNDAIEIHNHRGRFNDAAYDIYYDSIDAFNKLEVHPIYNVFIDSIGLSTKICNRDFWSFYTENDGFSGVYKIQINNQTFE